MKSQAQPSVLDHLYEIRLEGRSSEEGIPPFEGLQMTTLRGIVDILCERLMGELEVVRSEVKERISTLFILPPPGLKGRVYSVDLDEKTFTLFPMEFQGRRKDFLQSQDDIPEHLLDPEDSCMEYRQIPPDMITGKSPDDLFLQLAARQDLWDVFLRSSHA